MLSPGVILGCSLEAGRKNYHSRPPKRGEVTLNIVNDVGSCTVNSSDRIVKCRNLQRSQRSRGGRIVARARIHESRAPIVSGQFEDPASQVNNCFFPLIQSQSLLSLLFLFEFVLLYLFVSRCSELFLNWGSSPFVRELGANQLYHHVFRSNNRPAFCLVAGLLVTDYVRDWRPMPGLFAGIE